MRFNVIAIAPKGSASRPAPSAARNNRFGIGRAEPLRVEIVGDQVFDAALDREIAADLAIVHEHVLAIGEWMAILAARWPCRGGAHMGEEECERTCAQMERRFSSTQAGLISR